MSERASVDQLLAAVAAWIGEAGSQLQGRDAFNARVAQRALAIARRDLAGRAGADDRARARLAALLGHEGELRELDTAFRHRLQTGELAPDAPGVLDHLRATTLEELAIDQPDYGLDTAATPGKPPATNGEEGR